MTEYRGIILLQHFKELDKQMQIRVDRWLDKIVRPLVSSNPAIRKNRNNYAALLAYDVKMKDLREPFHKLPPVGRLPMLPGHYLLRISEPRHTSGKKEILNINPYRSAQTSLQEVEKELCSISSFLTRQDQYENYSGDNSKSIEKRTLPTIDKQPQNNLTLIHELGTISQLSPSNLPLDFDAERPSQSMSSLKFKAKNCGDIKYANNPEDFLHEKYKMKAGVQRAITMQRELKYDAYMEYLDLFALEAKKFSIQVRKFLNDDVNAEHT